MAKFIKSIFQTTDRRKTRHEEPEEDKNSSTPPLGERRKLSMSRSGRMKQANKKRNSLSLELYNQGLEMSEKRNSLDFKTAHKQIIFDANKTQEKNPRSQTPEIANTEEEIDNAFAIIDKT